MAHGPPIFSRREPASDTAHFVLAKVEREKERGDEWGRFVEWRPEITATGPGQYITRLVWRVCDVFVPRSVV